jgi:hypothetical protein
MKFKALPVTGFEDATLDFEQLQELYAPAGGLFLPAKAYWSAAGVNTYTTSAIFPFDTVSFDLTGGSMMTGAGGQYGFVAPVTGYYFASSTVAAAPTGAGQAVSAAITVGGATNYRVNLGYQLSTGAEAIEVTGSGIVAATAAQLIAVTWVGTNGVQGTGNAENVNNLMVMRVA